VASAFTAARFINGEAISGNLLGLRIAAGNTPNQVDLETGGRDKETGSRVRTRAIVFID
jgi:hypothetical protein